MNNPFLESPANLRKEWKLLRNSLTSDLSDIEQLNRTVGWWAQCPTVSQWLDYDNIDTWPNPWELITTKNLDYSAISLGIEYTLLLNGDGRWTTDRLHICLASDIEKTMQHLVVIVDNKLVLNASYAKVIDLTDNLIVHSRYKYDKTHIEISK